VLTAVWLCCRYLLCLAISTFLEAVMGSELCSFPLQLLLGHLRFWPWGWPHLPGCHKWTSNVIFAANVSMKGLGLMNFCYLVQWRGQKMLDHPCSWLKVIIPGPSRGSKVAMGPCSLQLSWDAAALSDCSLPIPPGCPRNGLNFWTFQPGQGEDAALMDMPVVAGGQACNVVK